MRITHRFLLTSTTLTPTVPVVISYPTKENDQPPTIKRGGEEYYQVPGSKWRGGNRRYSFQDQFAKRRAVDANFKANTASVRLFLIGGVRGSNETSPDISPNTLQIIREKMPLLDCFGMNMPIFMGGGVGMGIATSMEPVEIRQSQRGFPYPVYQQQDVIRRSILADHTLKHDQVEDWDTALEDQDANRHRAAMQRDLDSLKVLDRKNDKSSAILIAAVRKFSETYNEGVIFDDVAACERHMEQHKKNMTTSTVSENNLQKVGVIPAGTPMTHMIDLGQARGLGAYAIGLFLAGLHRKNKYDPVVGGLSSRGNGGLFKATYNVRYFDSDADEFVHDGDFTIVPYEGIKLSSNSRLNDMFRAWQQANVRDLPFSYDELVAIIANKG